MATVFREEAHRTAGRLVFLVIEEYAGESWQLAPGPRRWVGNVYQRCEREVVSL